MIGLKFFCTSAAVLYGVCTAFRKKMPLFYKIIFFAVVSYWMGLFYQILGEQILPAAVSGFHVGYLGYAGMFFFLLSSYYGAMDSLADGGEKTFRKYRMLAAVLPVLASVLHVWMFAGKTMAVVLLDLLILIPAAGTAYYAGKHLLMPDVKMGIIRVMRIYNGDILGICMLCVLTPLLPRESSLYTAAECLESVLLAISLPLAHKGVMKWYI